MGKVGRFLKKLGGAAEKGAKRLFSKDNMTSLVRGVADVGSAVGVPSSLTNTVGDSVVNAAYNTNFKKKGAVGNFIKGAVNGIKVVPRMAPGGGADDDDVSGSGLKKGSAEAKAHMARLRAMRKGGKSSVGKAIRAAVGKIAGGSLKPWSSIKKNGDWTGSQLMSMGMDKVSGDSVNRWNYGRSYQGKGFVPLGH